MSKKPNNDFSIWEWILKIDIILIVIATIGTLIEPIVGVLCPILVVILIVVSIACAIRTKKKNNNEIKLENEKNQEADCIEKNKSKSHTGEIVAIVLLVYVVMNVTIGVALALSNLKHNADQREIIPLEENTPSESDKEASLKKALNDNDMFGWSGSQYAKKYAGEFVNSRTQKMTLKEDGTLIFDLQGLSDEVKQEFFGSSGDGEYIRTLYHKGHYEDSSAFFRDPDNGDYTVIEVSFTRYTDNKNNNLSFHMNSNKYKMKFVKSTPKTTTNSTNYSTSTKKSSNYSTSTKNSYSSNASDKKEWNTLTCDPDDYDDPDEYADDAYGTDFDDWDEAYDFYEDW